MTKTPARILIVDDEPQIARIVHDTLVRAGYLVAVATNATDAFRSAKLDPPEIIFMDIGLAPNTSGLDVAREMRTDPRLENAYLVFLTGSDDPALREAAREIGAVAYITKPFSPRHLCDFADQLLARGPESVDAFDV